MKTQFFARTLIMILGFGGLFCFGVFFLLRCLNHEVIYNGVVFYQALCLGEAQ